MKNIKPKKIMILGASILQLPAILKAKEMGLIVIAVDKDKNAIGFKDADVCLEISTIDIPKVVEEAKRHNIDGVITLASDMPIRTVAAVAKELDLVGITEETALIATNKALMRERLKQHNVPIPFFFRVSDYSSYLTMIDQFEKKFVVKPADNSGSRGVILVQDKDCKQDIDFAFDYSKKYSRSGEIVVEEYMEGPEVSVETLSFEGEVSIIAITDKLTTGPPNFVEMGHSQPSQLSHEIQSQIMNVTIRAVKAIGIDNGPSHTEIIVTNEGPKIVELGARLGGDNITTHLVPLSSGVDMVKCSIEICLDEKPNFDREFDEGSAIRYLKTQIGIIKNISGLDKANNIPGVKQIEIVKSVGDYVSEIRNSSDRVGFIIAQAKNAEAAIRVCNEAMSILKVDK